MSKKRIRVRNGKNSVEEVNPAPSVSEDHLQETPPTLEEGSPIPSGSNEAPDEGLHEVVPSNTSGQDTPSSGQGETSSGMTQDTLSNISLVQKYSIISMQIYADCAVKLDPEEVFHVLARNFDSSSLLSWWLHRIGHGDKAKYAKGRDLIEYIRKIAHELHRDLKNVGRPIARF
jgi:hypothetical protein